MIYIYIYLWYEIDKDMNFFSPKQLIASSQFRDFCLFNIFIPLAFFIFAIWFMPINQVFQFDAYDEGIELIKATLRLDGFTMYTQMWNDQPPMSTVILSFWLGMFGKSILAARLLTLTFSTILIWSFCQIIRVYLGNIAAIIATILLIISCNFLRLSVSVMFGLPSLAIALLSFYTLIISKRIYRQQICNYILIIISGSLLALSLQIKLFTAFLIPLIICELIKDHLIENRQKVFQKIFKSNLFLDISLWITSLIITFIVIGIFCNSLTYQQLLKSHIDDSVRIAFDRDSSIKLTLSFLLQDFDYLLLAILSIIIIWRKKQWEQIFPITWLVTTYILLLNHRPVWYHHYLLISIPLVWLATYGIMLSFDYFQQSNRNPIFPIFPILNIGKLKKISLSGFASILVIFSIIVIPIKLGITQWENHKFIAQSQERKELLNVVLANKKSTHWFFTDCPIYAFYSGLLVPPEIAVLSQIRIDSKTITRAEFLRVLQTYQPEQILLCKSPLIRDYLTGYLTEHYRKIYESAHLGINYLKLTNNL